MLRPVRSQADSGAAALWGPGDRLTGVAMLLGAVVLVAGVWAPLCDTAWAVRVAAFAGALAALGVGVVRDPAFFSAPDRVQRRWARLVALAGLLAALAAGWMVRVQSGINDYQSAAPRLEARRSA